MAYINIEEENKIADVVYEASREVFETLGPGLLESAYEMCLERELKLRGLDVQRQVPVPLSYKQVSIETAYRADMIVEGKVIIELKSVKEIEDIFFAQLNTYLKIANKKLGILINFNVPYIGAGFKRWIVKK